MTVFFINHNKDGTYTVYVNTKKHGKVSLDDLIDKIDKVLDKVPETEKEKEETE